MTEDIAFLESINHAYPGVRASWVGRVPGLSVAVDRDTAMARLRPHHEAALQRFAGPDAACWRAEQVHGCSVAVVPGPPVIVAADDLPVVAGVDGLLTATRGQTLAIYVADCGAIWLVDRRSGAIGLLHSGKKGTEGGILATALARMEREFGTRPEDVVCVLGPCIRLPHYETDFAATIAAQARSAGVGHYFDCGADTGSDLLRFYSYRLEKGRTGRMMALLTKDTP